MLVSNAPRNICHLKIGDKVVIAHAGATISNSATTVVRISRTHVTTARSRYLAEHRFSLDTGLDKQGSCSVHLVSEAERAHAIYKEGKAPEWLPQYRRGRSAKLYIGEGAL